MRTAARSLRPRRPSPTALACRRVAAAASAAAPATELPRWVEAGGGSAAGVAVRVAGAALGYELVASRSANKGDLLVSLPRSLLLADGSPAAALPPEREAALRALQAAVPAELWGGRLALRVLGHRAWGGDSPFHSYVAALPAGFATPLFFSPAAVDALREYAPAHAQIIKRARWVASFAGERLGAAAAAGGGASPFFGLAVDAGGLAWALSAVTSRAFAVSGAAAGAARALLPLVDMANHAFDAAASVEGGAGGGVTLRAARALAAGDAITLNYGALPSDDYLLDYGFVPSPNPHDSVPAAVDAGLLAAAADLARTAPPPATDAAPWRAPARARLGPPPPAGAQLRAAPPFADARLLSEARAVVAATAAELAASPPSLDARAFRTLAAAAMLSLSSFSAPAAADEALLQDGSLPADVAAAVAVRLAKKTTLEAAARGLGAAARAAEGEKAAKKGVAKQGKGFGGNF